MRLFGFDLTRSPRDLEIARPRASSGEKTAPAVLERLNQLETTLEGLQLEHADRQLAVLNAVEKVLHQLGARQRKREREEPEPDQPPQLGFDRGEPLDAKIPMVNRFRRF